MDSFAGCLAVVTGGGSGIGRELVRQLVADGASVAMCDVSPEGMAEPERTCAPLTAPGAKVTSFMVDVTDEAQFGSFLDHVLESHSTDHIHLLANCAGLAGGGSFVAGDRDECERTFDVNWRGVYLGTRTFLPLLMAAPEGHVANVSSGNALWASLGLTTPNTAYSAAKFAVRGFPEALITDLRLHAPHVRASLVMPGHVGTDIIANSARYFGRHPKDLTEAQIAVVRQQLTGAGLPVEGASDDEIRDVLTGISNQFRDNAPTSAAEAASIILDGVRTGAWRIFVGRDAAVLDELVRAFPEEAYEPSFIERLQAAEVLEGVAWTRDAEGVDLSVTTS